MLRARFLCAVGESLGPEDRGPVLSPYGISNYAA
jgi:hypothetical protein